MSASVALRARRPSNLSRYRLALLAGTALAAAGGAQAADWTGATSQDWAVAGNWTPAAVPDATTVVNINTGLLNGSTITTAGQLARSVTLGTLAGQTGVLTVDGGALTVGAGAVPNPGFSVGDLGSGVLTLRNGGTLNSGWSYVALNLGSAGAATVDGAGSVWNISQWLDVGSSGNGALTITNGGRVNFTFVGRSALFASDVGARARLVVDGAGSQLNVPGAIFGNATGALGAEVEIRNGGLFTSGITTLGSRAPTTMVVASGGDATASILTIGGTGTAELLVSGAGSTYAASNLLSITNNGKLTVEDGAVVTSSIGQLGAGQKLTVTGAGSRWSMTGGLTATGAPIDVLNGGMIAANMFTAANNPQVLVSGANSHFNMSGAILVGSAANNGGVFDVLAGGRVSGLLYTAQNSALVNVSGAGSVFGVTNAFNHGQTGALNRLNVLAGGTLNTGNANITTPVSGGMAALVSGMGSTWNAGAIRVGGTGASTLVVTDDAQVNVNVGSSGELIVDGAPGTQLTISDGARVIQYPGTAATGQFRLGVDAHGTLLIESGGVLETQAHPTFSSFAFLARNAGSSATATITGAGSRWTHSHLIVVGQGGPATLSILDGGTLNGYGSTSVAVTPGVTASILVSGAGSNLTSALSPPLSGLSNLTLGRGGSGSLRVENGGSVTVEGLAIGGLHNTFSIPGPNTRTPGSATAVVTGPTSRINLDIASFQSLGLGGDGSTGVLDILNGARVNLVGTTNLGQSIFYTDADVNGVNQYFGEGTINIDGAGSQLTMTQRIEVGEQAEGTVNIRNGGLMTSNQGFIGSFATVRNIASGAVNVTGAGSTWTNSGQAVIGDQGIGALTISAGGVVSNTTGSIADRAATGVPVSQGTVTVTGAGSTWTNSGMLTVANRGAGVLTIADGGTVHAGGVAGTGAVRIGQLAGSTGTLNIGAATASPAAAAGVLNAASVTFGAGTGALNFNHTGANHIFAPAIGGAGAINHLAGTTTLTGVSPHTGATTVSGGLLRVNGSLASAMVAVASGASLAGAGTLSGATDIAGGGNLLGAAGAVLTLGSLALADTSNLNAALGAPSGTAIFNVTNGLTLDGRLNVTNAGGFGLGSYRLFDYAGAFTNNGLVINSLPVGFNPGNWEIDTATAGQVNLLVQAGPREQYWDGGNMAPGLVAGGRGGTSVWNAANTNWTNAAGTINALWASDFGVFGGTAGTVTVVGIQDFLGLRFVTSGYNLLPGAGGALRMREAATPIEVVAGQARIAAPLQGLGGLLKTGAGALELAGTSTYAGATSVSNGLLRVNGSVASPTVNVASNASLAGIGTLTGAVNIADGGSLLGAAGGVLTLGDLTLADSSNLNVTLGVPSDIALFNVTGGLTLDGRLNVTNGGFGLGSYRLFDYGGAFTNNGLVITTLPVGFNPGDWEIDVATAGQVNLRVIPGPGEQFWDGGFMSPGGIEGGRGGAGVWNAANTNWTNFQGLINAPWAGGTGVFGGVGGLVTVQGIQAFRSLRFVSDGYQVVGDALSAPTGALIDVASRAETVIASSISGFGGLNKSGGGRLVLTGSNSYQQGTRVELGELAAAATGALSTGPVTVAFGANLSLVNAFDAEALQFTNGGLMRLLNASTTEGARIDNFGILDISGHGSATVAVGALSGGGAVRLGGKRLLLGGLGGDQTIDGVISGAGGVTKVGAGQLTLGGNSIYAGETRATDGMLRITGRVAGDASVEGAGRLSGTGEIAGLLRVADGGRLEGRAGEQLRLGALDLTDSGVLHAFLGAPSGRALFAVDGNVDLDGALVVSNLGGFGLGDYRLIDYGGVLGRTGLVISSLPAGHNPGDWRIDTTTFGQVSLVVGLGDGVQYWDGAQTVPGHVGGGRGGSGVWTSSTTNWTNAAGDINAPWASGKAAFGGLGGVVRIDGEVEAGSLRFLSDGYRLIGGERDALRLFGLTPVEVAGGRSAEIAATIAGDGRLAKTGDGRLILSGANSYTGETVVAAGALRVNGALASPEALVAAGGTLEGTGILAGAVRVAADGRIAPGAGGAGTLSVGALHLAQGAQLDFDLGPPDIVGGENDLISVAGDLTLDGTLNVNDVGGFGAGVYRLIDYGGALTDHGLELGALPQGVSADRLAVQTAIGHQVNLVYGTTTGPGPTPTGGVQFWDGAGPAADGVIAGGAGTWNAAAAWTGANGEANRGWGGGFAVFQGAGGAVTVDAPVSFTGLQFMEGGYRIDGAGLTTATADTVIRVDPGVSAEIGSAIGGAGGLLKRDSGVLTLTGANSYAGGTRVMEGVLRVGSDSALGAASGGLTLDGGTLALAGNLDSARAITLGAAGGTLDTEGRSGYLSGVISGAGGLTKTGAGLLVLTGQNTYGGGVEVLDGHLMGNAASLRGPILNEARVSFDQAVDAAYAGGISGSGVLNKLGAGVLALTGDGGAFAGQTNVLAGRLQVDGTLGGSLYVDAGAHLQGTGQVGLTAVAGTVSPGGGAIGTLTVNGDYAQLAGSTYRVDINPAGGSDLISVRGAASLQGGTVQVEKLPGTYAPGLRYTILTAAGGVTGGFAQLQQNLPFVDLRLAYTPNAAHLDVARNGAAFASVAKTQNQAAAPAGAEGLGEGSALYGRIALLDADDARAAFDALSGETHASLRRSLLDDSRYLRAGVSDRLRAAGEDAPSGTWALSFGAHGQVRTDGNAAGAGRDIEGLLLGGDLALGEHVRAGFATGHSVSRMNVDARLSTAATSTHHLAGYLGAQAGGWRAHLGAGYSWHTIATARGVAFSGFYDTARAEYGGATAQLFGEAAYAARIGKVEIEPFLGFAHVSAKSDAFAEAGGEAALAAAGRRDSFTTVSLGVRPSVNLDVGRAGTLRLQGGLAWRHAFDEVTPLAEVRFRAGGAGFSPAAAPIARDAMAVEGRAELSLSPNAAVAVDYSGQVSQGASDHAVKAGLVLRF